MEWSAGPLDNGRREGGAALSSRGMEWIGSEWNGVEFGCVALRVIRDYITLHYVLSSIQSPNTHQFMFVKVFQRQRYDIDATRRDLR